MIFRCKLNNNKRQKSRTSDSHLSIYLEELARKDFKVFVIYRQTERKIY